ncbi:hypothetical protein GW17_00052952 [Ensete ventricosum]|nr:hypothetical protein GW17_00052952 [Ensete ventricosum]
MCSCCEDSEEEGQPATASPMQGWPPTAWPRPRPPARGGRRWLGQQPAREAGVARGGSSTQGRRLRAKPAGARKGLPLAASHAASRGGGVGRKGGRPLAGWLPAGKGSRRLRRGSSDDDGSADGARGRGGYSGTHDAVAGDRDAWGCNDPTISMMTRSTITGYGDALMHT